MNRITNNPRGSPTPRRGRWPNPSPRGRGVGSGFTLVELLVVVSIIAILLALLTPALDKAMDEATKSQCAANLHAFGSGHFNYAMDNKRRIMTMPRHYKAAGQASGQGLAYPWFAWLYQDTQPQEFSVEAIQRYIGGDARTLSKVWLCPSSAMLENRKANDSIMAANLPRGPTNDAARDDGFGILAEYTCFGGGDSMPLSYPTRPQRLSSPRLGSVGILMADIVFRHSNTAFYYNHGEYEKFPAAVPKIDGFNRLGGDGSAGWLAFTTARAAALWSVGPKDDMGDYVSAIGQGDKPTASTGDLFTLY